MAALQNTSPKRNRDQELHLFPDGISNEKLNSFNQIQLVMTRVNKFKMVQTVFKQDQTSSAQNKVAQTGWNRFEPDLTLLPQTGFNWFKTVLTGSEWFLSDPTSPTGLDQIYIQPVWTTHNQFWMIQSSFDQIQPFRSV